MDDFLLMISAVCCRWFKRPDVSLAKAYGADFSGSENFVARKRELLGDRQEMKEIPRVQRYPGRSPLDRLFANITKRDRPRRNDQVVQAHVTYGYTLKEIATVSVPTMLQSAR